MAWNKGADKKYNPTPFHNKNAQGEHIHHKRRAQEAAKHLSEKQWGEDTNREQQETILTHLELVSKMMEPWKNED